MLVCDMHLLIYHFCYVHGPWHCSPAWDGEESLPIRSIPWNEFGQWDSNFEGFTGGKYCGTLFNATLNVESGIRSVKMLQEYAMIQLVCRLCLWRGATGRREGLAAATNTPEKP